MCFAISISSQEATRNATAHADPLQSWRRVPLWSGNPVKIHMAIKVSGFLSTRDTVVSVKCSIQNNNEQTVWFILCELHKCKLYKYILKDLLTNI